MCNNLKLLCIICIFTMAVPFSSKAAMRDDLVTSDSIGIVIPIDARHTFIEPKPKRFGLGDPWPSLRKNFFTLCQSLGQLEYPHTEIDGITSERSTKWMPISEVDKSFYFKTVRGNYYQFLSHKRVKNLLLRIKGVAEINVYTESGLTSEHTILSYVIIKHYKDQPHAVKYHKPLPKELSEKYLAKYRYKERWAYLQEFVNKASGHKWIRAVDLFDKEIKKRGYEWVEVGDYDMFMKMICANTPISMLQLEGANAGVVKCYERDCKVYPERTLSGVSYYPLGKTTL